MRWPASTAVAEYPRDQSGNVTVTRDCVYSHKSELLLTRELVIGDAPSLGWIRGRSFADGYCGARCRESSGPLRAGSLGVKAPRRSGAPRQDNQLVPAVRLRLFPRCPCRLRSRELSPFPR